MENNAISYEFENTGSGLQVSESDIDNNTHIVGQVYFELTYQGIQPSFATCAHEELSYITCSYGHYYNFIKLIEFGDLE